MPKTDRERETMSNVREGAKIGTWVIGGVIALAVVYVVGIFAFGGANWITAPFRGEADKREQTTGSGAFRIASYEDYFGLCSSVQNAESSIKALKEEKEDASPTRTAQINTSITALKASRAESIHEYNAKSSQEHRAPFKDKGLPERLDENNEETTCA